MAITVANCGIITGQYSYWLYKRNVGYCVQYSYYTAYYYDMVRCLLTLRLIDDEEPLVQWLTDILRIDC